MTTLVQVAPGGVIVEGGWWPRIAWAVRASDGRLVARIPEWRGGQGDPPPTGYVAESGVLTDDADQAWAFPASWVDVVGTRGNAVGEPVALMRIAAGTAAGEITSTWSGVAADFEADNGNPGDTAAKLRVPNNPAPDQLGWVFIAEEDGETRTAMLAWGEFTGAKGALFELPPAGENLTVRLRASLVGEQNYMEIACRTGPISHDVTVTVHRLLTGVAGVQASELAAVRDAVAANTAAIAELHSDVQALPTDGGAAPRQATAEELDAGEETRLRSFSAADVWRAARAAVSRMWLAVRTGGWVRSATAAAGQLHIVAVADDGTESTTTITLGDGAGGTQAHTDQQIRNLAGALIGGTAPFEYDAGTGTLTWTQPPPKARSVTLAMLAASLVAVLDGKVDAASLDGLIAANAHVVAHEAFERALRRTTPGPGGAWRQATSGAYVELATSWPQFAAGDRLTLTVGGVALTVDAADLEAVAANRADQGSADNGLVIHDRALAQTYYVSKAATRRILVASDTDGNWALASAIDGIAIDPATQVPDGSIAKAKLDAATQAEIDAEGVTLADVDREIAKRELAKDEEAHGNFTAARLAEGEIGAAIAVALGDVTFGRVFQDPLSHDIQVWATPSADAATVARKQVGILDADGDVVWKMALASASEARPIPTAPGTFRWLWTGQPAATLVAGTNYRFGVFAAPDEDNLVPGTGDGALFRDGGTPAFRKIRGGRKASGAIAALPSDFDRPTLDKWDSLQTGAQVNPPPVAEDVAAAGVDPRLFSWSPHRIDQLVQARAPRGHPQTTLHDGSGTGLSVTSSGRTWRSVFTAFRPTPTTHFVLTDDDNRNGVLDVEAWLEMQTVSATDIGFDIDTSDPQRAIRLSGFTFARKLRNAAAFSAGADHGVRLASAVCRQGSTNLGVASLWVGHDAANNAGYWVTYVGASGSASWALALNPLEAVFFFAS